MTEIKTLAQACATRMHLIHGNENKHLVLHTFGSG
jgi:hypothetical protein